MSDIPTARRSVITRRSAGFCEWCGRVGDQVHHRKRGHPRNHDVANMVRLCGPCHHICTYDMPRAARYGFVVTHSAPESLLLPIALLSRAWVTLTPQGGYRCGGVAFAGLDEIHEAIEAVTAHGVGPTDALTSGESAVVAHGVVAHSALGERRGGDGLVGEVERPSIPARFLVQRGEDLADLRARLFEEL